MTNNGPDEHIPSDITATILGNTVREPWCSVERGGVIDVGVIKELPLYISYSFTGFSMILSLWSSLKRDLFV